MLVKAVKSFIGKVCMNCGDTLDIDDNLANRLADCNYVQIIDDTIKTSSKKRGGKKSESK